MECVWALCTPKQTLVQNGQTVKRIAIGSYYVSPKARNKQDIIEHIIDSIHTLRAKYNNEVNFLISGDFNRLDISDILDCYGAIKQICSVPTRNSATLEIVLTDLHTLYHPPTTLPPLQVDSDKLGKDSDHDVVLFAPKSDNNYKCERKKKIIRTRPLPESQIVKFEQELAKYPWDQVFSNKSVNEQVELFHLSPYVAKVLVTPVIQSLIATRISFRFLRLVLSKTPQFILALMANQLSKEVELWYANLNLYSIIIYTIILFSLTCKYTTCLVIPPGFISDWPQRH